MVILELILLLALVLLIIQFLVRWFTSINYVDILSAYAVLFGDTLKIKEGYHVSIKETSFNSKMPGDKEAFVFLVEIISEDEGKVVESLIFDKKEMSGKRFLGPWDKDARKAIVSISNSNLEEAKKIENIQKESVKKDIEKYKEKR